MPAEPGTDLRHFQTRPLLLVVSAPSGGGKTTVCQGLLEKCPSFSRAITCTTRVPRVGEMDGRDYYFLSAEAFRAKLEAGEFLEHATVHDHLYGTLRQEVLDHLGRNGDVVLNIDVQGAASVRGRVAEIPLLAGAIVSVFLMPPSLAELQRRLQRRAQDPAETIARRLEAARRETEHWREFDYVMVSGSVAEDLRRLQVVVESERMRAARAVLKPI